MHPSGRVVFPVDIINTTWLSTNVKTAGMGCNGGLRGCRRRYERAELAALVGSLSARGHATGVASSRGMMMVSPSSWVMYPCASFSMTSPAAYTWGRCQP